jgi:hypothetical protein
LSIDLLQKNRMADSRLYHIDGFSDMDREAVIKEVKRHGSLGNKEADQPLWPRPGAQRHQHPC